MSRVNPRSKFFALVLILLVSTISSPTVAQNSNIVAFYGEWEYDQAGYSVAGVGDVNGDGYDDVVIGAPYHDGEMGKVYLCFGSANPLTTINLEDCDATFLGGQNDDEAGYRVEGIGDFNNDTYDDFLVGAWSCNQWTTNAGCVYLIYGNQTQNWQHDMLLSDFPTFQGESSYNNLGMGLSSLGDIDMDGYDDFMIGAPQNDRGATYSGSAYLFYGRNQTFQGTNSAFGADAIFHGESSYCYLGQHNSMANGDFNGDGYQDILLGAYGCSNSRGKVYIHYGNMSRFSGINDTADANMTIIGERSGDLLGFTVSSGGDINGDGLDDMLLTAQNYDYEGVDEGLVYLVYGSSDFPADMDAEDIISYFVGEENYDYLGRGIIPFGDLNDDGYDDFAITAYGSSNYHGRVYLFQGSSDTELGLSGMISLSDAILQYSGTNNERFGFSMDSAGDFNGDGIVDIIIGAPYNSENETRQGAVYLYYSSAPPPVTSPPADTDGDGLTDAQESQYGTNPELNDTDSDGLSDYEETITYGTDPNDPDSDDDGINDGDEIANGSDPRFAEGGTTTSTPTTTSDETDTTGTPLLMIPVSFALITVGINRRKQLRN